MTCVHHFGKWRKRSLHNDHTRRFVWWRMCRLCAAMQTVSMENPDARPGT